MSTVEQIRHALQKVEEAQEALGSVRFNDTGTFESDFYGAEVLKEMENQFLGRAVNEAGRTALEVQKAFETLKEHFGDRGLGLRAEIYLPDVLDELHRKLEGDLEQREKALLEEVAA